MAKGIKCKPEQLAKTVDKIMKDYYEAVNLGVKEAVHETGKACKKLVKAYARSSGIGGSKYINSFRVSVDKDSYYVTNVTVHSSMYRLTHLLENGHYLVYFGKPTGRRTRAFPHWQPAEEKATEMLEKKIKVVCEDK